MHKPRPISGYPEWLPEVRSVELDWLDRLRAVFESHGFCSIETPIVEELAVLAAKGETADKEIYVLSRLNAEESQKESRLGLHYDLTVPFARYVAQHYSNLSFPFKRYQMQKVWRGERPQEGRFREFYQCDIDVISPDSLSDSFDVEIPLIMAEALAALPIGEVEIKISNRKILQGYLQGLGVKDSVLVIREIDKLDKIGHEKVVATLTKNLGLDHDTATRCLAIADIRSSNLDFLERVAKLGVQSDILTEGLDELAKVFAELRKTSDVFSVDLGIARGFDYYTGVIVEAGLKDYPEFSTIAAGGRYDDLASSYTKHSLPGIGISIGLSRLFSKMLSENKLETTKRTPTEVLVTWTEGDDRETCLKVANTLRVRGLNVEAYHSPDRLKKQIKYADKKGIPFVWFSALKAEGTEALLSGEVKNLETGEQLIADAKDWTPR